MHFPSILQLHRRKGIHIGFFIILLCTAGWTSGVIGAEPDVRAVCIYTDEGGVFRQVDGPEAVPEVFRASARCAKVKAKNYLAAPESVEIDGSERKADFPSSLGIMHLRWARSAEKLFGRSPERAMADAARTVSRALKQSGFPSALRTLHQDWEIVFLDADLPESQIPVYLRTNCHPAWMTPPANIYVVSRRVAGGCGGQAKSQSASDAMLAEVLIHELGHAVEAVLLGSRFSDSSARVRAEGFATWFESYAAEFSSLIPAGSVQSHQLTLARNVIGKSHARGKFVPTEDNYVLASLPFHVVVERKGVRGLMAVYELMAQDGIAPDEAIRRVTGWSEKEMSDRVGKLLGKRGA